MSELEEAREALLNVFEAGLKDPLQTCSQTTLKHRVFRAIFKGKCPPCKTSFLLEKEDFPGDMFPRGWQQAYVNTRPTIPKVIFPVKIHLFRSGSPKLYHADGTERKRRVIQRVTLTFRKETLNPATV